MRAKGVECERDVNKRDRAMLKKTKSDREMIYIKKTVRCLQQKRVGKKISCERDVTRQRKRVGQKNASSFNAKKKNHTTQTSEKEKRLLIPAFPSLSLPPSIPLSDFFSFAQDLLGVVVVASVSDRQVRMKANGRGFQAMQNRFDDSRLLPALACVCVCVCVCMCVMFLHLGM